MTLEVMRQHLSDAEGEARQTLEDLLKEKNAEIERLQNGFGCSETLIRIERDALREENVELNSKFKQVAHELWQKKVLREEGEGVISELKAQMFKLRDNFLNKAKAAAEEMTPKNEEYISALRKAENTLRDFRDKCKRLEEELWDSEALLKTKDKECTVLHAESFELKETKSRLLAELHATRIKAEKDVCSLWEAENKVDKLRNELEEAKRTWATRFNEKHNELQTLQDTFNNAVDERCYHKMGEANDKISILQGQNKFLMDKVSDLQTQVLGLGNNQDNSVDCIADLERRLAISKNETHAAHALVDDLHAQIRDKESRMQILKDQDEFKLKKLYAYDEKISEMQHTIEDLERAIEIQRNDKVSLMNDRNRYLKMLNQISHIACPSS